MSYENDLKIEIRNIKQDIQRIKGQVGRLKELISQNYTSNIEVSGWKQEVSNLNSQLQHLEIDLIAKQSALKSL